MEGLEKIKKAIEKKDKKMKCGDFEWEVNYFDVDGKIKVDLFSDIAEKIVFKCIKYLTYDDQSNKRKISINQMRKFYNEILNYQIQINSISYKEKKLQKFRELLPLIKMEKAKANIAYQKKNMNTNFKRFIDKNIDYIVEGYDKDLEKSLEKFTIFVSLFEAVIAYAKGVINEN
ncbi:type III-A CRISPR-associated protein Csm2 [Nitratiruptor tergarcus]|uniref:CRISPR system Cms protein Csm2 n=1 Tax=Nitratiruptor tergarcus DSM 16512 TaxID=1069081 RepID=A0A1W1WSB6_9BACT|nr:type III-A CRISPR-associated protein Csm2 [Nitratiruptor tergarcus]SMC09194.1 Protein of unknown function [Nitratiruptor tergarcus DSM 16512]